jgi:hypothetical protein
MSRMESMYDAKYAHYQEKRWDQEQDQTREEWEKEQEQEREWEREREQARNLQPDFDDTINSRNAW